MRCNDLEKGIMKEFDTFTQFNMSLLIPISKVGKDSEVFNDKLGFYRIVIDFNSQAKHHNHHSLPLR